MTQQTVTNLSLWAVKERIFEAQQAGRFVSARVEPVEGKRFLFTLTLELSE